MRKIWLRKTGGPEVLKVEESQESVSVGDDEVQIDVHYSGINFADVIMRVGLYQDAPKRPYVPGYEVSGLVTRTGKSVSRVRVGDVVAAGTRFGGYSSEVVVHQDLVFKMPVGLTLPEAAALPVNWITAHAALMDMGRVRPGDRVLLDCASGGVGTLAMQILKQVGAETVGLTSSPSKMDYIRSYGASAMTHEEFARDDSQFDLVLNSMGGKSVRQHYNRLVSTGRVIAIGMSSGMRAGKRDYLLFLKMVLEMPRFSLISMFDKNRGVYALNALSLLGDERFRSGLGAKWEFVEKFGLKPHVEKIFPAAEAGAAHALLESRGARGKVLLSWK